MKIGPNLGLKLLLLTTVLCSGIFAQTLETGQVVEVPFEFIKNQIVLQVKIDGKGPFNMLLDTGTDPSAVDIAAAKEMGLKLASTGHQGSGGGTSVNLSYVTKFPLVEIGDLTAKNVNALAIDLSKTSEQMGKLIHGILGQSLLNKRIVQIDYPHRVVRFYERSPFSKAINQANTANRTTFSFRYDDNVLIDGVTVNGKTMTANFDTGSSGIFQLTPNAVFILGLDNYVSKAKVSRSVGFNGESVNHEGTVKNVTISGISVDDPAVLFFAKGTGRDKKTWGVNIGNGFLKDFIVTIDYRSKTITLEKP